MGAISVWVQFQWNPILRTAIIYLQIKFFALMDVVNLAYKKKQYVFSSKSK